MPATPESVRAAITGRLQLLNDQLKLFHQVRAVAFNTTAQSTYPAAAIREIRGLYQAFDAKHPPPKEIEA